jgi:probable HAF family extracellular repeat protein
MASYDFKTITHSIPSGATNFVSTLYPYGITASGKAFGLYTDSYNSGPTLIFNGIFSYENGSFSNITYRPPSDIRPQLYPNDRTSYFSGINDQGDIVGSYDSLSHPRGFINSHGESAPIEYPGATVTFLNGITNSGEIFGSYYLGANPSASHEFIYANEAFSTVEYPGAISTNIKSVNSSGDIVGYYTNNSGGTHSFFDDNGIFSTIDFPGSVRSAAAGINSLGQIVGTYTDSSQQSHGFFLSDDAYSNFDYPGASNISVSGISDGGQILGSYTDTAGSHTFIASPQPLLNASYRFFDTATGGHFYTTSVAEKAQIQAILPTYKYEGVGWSTPNNGADTIDVFRFFDTATKDHFYTTSAAERDQILNTLPTYQFEGVAFQAYASADTAGTGAVTLERFFNTVAKVHHFAANAQEAYAINHGSAGVGWVDEGPAFTVHTPTDGMLYA